MSDPIWDDTGTPDPTLETLRRMLEPLRWEDRPFVPPFWSPARRIALAAAFVVALAAVPLVLRLLGPSLAITLESGGIASTSRWQVKSAIDVPPDAKLTVALGTLGRVVARGGAHLSLQQADEQQHRIRLESGEIEASLVAPPRRFAVVTPHAVAVDLGCAFDLRVTADETWLGVTSGVVALEAPSATTVVPAGHVAIARAGRGPGLPFSIDASPELAAAAQGFDLGTATFSDVLAHATPRDAVTVFHLLQRAPATDRPRVFAKLLELAPPRAEIRAGVERGDADALAAWARDVLRTP